MFGSHVGFRGRDEEVSFPVVLGTASAPVQGQQRGVRHTQVRRRIEAVLKQFRADVVDLGERTSREAVPLRAALAPPIKLYARIIRVHPFIDGNGRTAWVAYSYALARCGAPQVVLVPTPETRLALGTAIRSDSKQSFEPLIERVEAAIKDAKP